MHTATGATRFSVGSSRLQVLTRFRNTARWSRPGALASHHSHGRRGSSTSALPFLPPSQVPVRQVKASAASWDTAPLASEAPSTHTFDWTEHWYPVAFARHIDKDAPYRFVLMEIPLVIWWDKTKATFRAFKDVCPHRLVPLSEGRINGRGELECGYHGWTFDGAGACTRIPQAGNSSTKRACAVAFPCLERQGLLFVRPTPYEGGDDFPLDEATIPTVAELESPDWIPQDTFRDLPYDWATLVENVVDASHVPFTHHATISSRYEIGAYDIKRTTPITAEGFRGVWGAGPRAGKLGSQYAWFRPPTYFQNKLSAPSRGYETMLIVYATPMAPGRCRLFNRNLFNFKSPLLRAIFKVYPEWLNHVNSHIPLEDDQVFLHLGEPTFNEAIAGGKTAAQACYMPSTADTLVIAFRNWVARFGGGGPFGDTSTEAYRSRLEPRQSTQQLFDRYSQHTQHCTVCKTALSRFRTLRSALYALSTTLLAFAILSAAIALTAASLPLPTPPTPPTTTASSAAAAAAAACAIPRLLVAVRHAVGALLLATGGWVVGGGGAEAAALRAGVWLAAAAAAWAAACVAGGWEAKFSRGTYPPPRNVAKDPVVG